MINVVGNLSTEDLNRWRVVCADKELVDAGHPGMSVSEAKTSLLKYYSIMNDFFNDYELDVAHIECYFISPFTGHILLNDAV